jgi:hypothetical protein
MTATMRPVPDGIALATGHLRPRRGTYTRADGAPKAATGHLRPRGPHTAVTWGHHDGAPNLARRGT